jgi:hypothetical protein
MRRNSLLWVRVKVLVVALAFVPAAHAYNSGTETPGPQAAQQPGWFGEDDNEHGVLLRDAMIAAGLPGVLRTQTFEARVFTDRSQVVNNFPSVTPVNFGVATNERTRRYNLPGLAGLPDHALWLWDWAEGHERCPSVTKTNDPVKCHSLDQHLGALNSTHFPPQTRSMYRWYHGLAMRRAAQCKTMAERLDASFVATADPDFTREMVLECEREAIALEVFGQHFLQDSLAVGHMWERWGGARVDDFTGGSDDEQLNTARLVAVTAGIIHGAEAITKIRDRLSGGGLEVKYDQGPGGTAPLRGIGDVHAAELRGGGIYAAQYELLMRCSASGLRAVYDATAQESGAVGAMTVVNIVPDSDSCFGQRATNQSMDVALAVDLGIAGTFKIDPVVATSLTPLVLAGAKDIEPPQAVVDEWRSDLAAISVGWTITAILNPLGIENASDTLSLAGVQSNNFYDRFPVSPDADPYFPQGDVKSWPGVADAQGQTWPLVDPATNARSLARYMHRAHAADWCDDNEADIGTLKARVTNAAAADLQTACNVCIEMTARHVELDGGGGVGVPSVCAVLNGQDGSPVAESPPANNVLPFLAESRLRSAAAKECGCAVTGARVKVSGITGAGLSNLNVPEVTVVQMSGPFDFFISASQTCGGERGPPLYSQIADQEAGGAAVFYPAAGSTGIDTMYNAPANRIPCSSFVAFKNAGADDEEIWINVTARRETFSTFGNTDREYQLRYYGGKLPDRAATRRCDIGRVVNPFAGFFRDATATCEHEILYTKSP